MSEDMNMEEATKVSTGRKALVGTMVKYHLGQYADGHVGHLCYINTDGDWIVRNASDGKQYVLRMQPETEPVPERRAKWSFASKQDLSDYLSGGSRALEAPTYTGYPYSNLPGKTVAKPQPKPETGDLVADGVNKALRDIKKRGTTHGRK